MRTSALTLAASFSFLLLGCGGRQADLVPPAGDDASVDGSIAACPPCVTDNDCSGGTCAQFGGDTYCAPACGSAGECAPDRVCKTVTTFSGQQASVCVPQGDVCGPSDPTSSSDAGATGGLCGTYAPPDMTAACVCASSKGCTANGCYGGWWCDTATNKCHAPPSGCPGVEAGTGWDGGHWDGGSTGPGPGVAYDPGAPVTGTVGTTGGSVSRLLFAVVGDTRPATIDDTSGYPTAIVTKIWQDVAALKVVPSFAVATGDYMFASPSGTQAGTQLDLYLKARAAFPNATFATMGNHECTGMTASNCGPGNKDGSTSNYTAFLGKMLGPIGQTKPYYSMQVQATDGSWTAKFLFVAGNAWSADQATWLDAAMAQKTTYTFIVRHEPASATTAPGVPPSEAIMAKYPYTLALVGHTHTYSHRNRQVIIGNGGAPLTGSGDYGFGVVSQRADGSLAVDVIDYQTGLADSAFHFAVNADGSPAAP